MSRQVEIGPTWEVAHLFPLQGQWSEGDYLSLNTNRIVELSDGRLEVLPLPTETHQELVLAIYETIVLFTRPRELGKVLVAPLRVKLWEGKFREPDVVFMLKANANRRDDQVWTGADLVVEVVSEDDPNRDLVVKKLEYAQAGISEYWIVNPRDRSISIHVLQENANTYALFSRASGSGNVDSKILLGLTIELASVFATG